jgi:repressor LexA
MGRTPPGETREKVFEFVRKRLLTGDPPTVREVQEHFGFRAVQTARQHLEALVNEGRLLVERGKSRGYRLPGADEPPPRMVPLLGRVAAGPLHEAVEDLEGYVPVQARGASDLFALRIQGDSMIDAGILPGDIIIVRVQAKANNGEIVVALVDDEATVKTFYKRRNRIELHPENSTMEPIVPDSPETVRILGKVIEVRREL